MTILHFALINHQSIKVKSDNVEEARWMPVDKALKEQLAFDHNKLLLLATARLRSRTTYTALPMSLLPNKLTMAEFKGVFEIILG